MGIGDMIKKSILEQFQASNLTTTTIVITLGIAAMMGLFVYMVYRINMRNGFYNRSFNKALATLPVITAAIMLAMGSNLSIGLGMVGALSIIRFRNAVKDPADLTYLFWSISIGIVVGAGLFELAILLSLGVTVLVMFLDMLPAFRAPGLLIVSAETVETEVPMLSCVKSYAKNVKVRSRNINKHGVEWILEMQIKNEQEMLKKISELAGVQSVNLMTHDGDVRF